MKKISKNTTFLACIHYCYYYYFSVLWILDFSARFLTVRRMNRTYQPDARRSNFFFLLRFRNKFIGHTIAVLCIIYLKVLYFYNIRNSYNICFHRVLHGFASDFFIFILQPNIITAMWANSNFKNSGNPV